jgi:hypothetical protein
MKYFLIYLISFNIFAGIVKYDVYGSEKNKFNFSDVCTHKYKKQFPLITVLNLKELDCMGKKAPVLDFCKTKINANLVRAFIDKKTRKVICQKGNRIVFKYDCKSNIAYCKSSITACALVKNDLAVSLHLIHGSVTENNLNCYFSADRDDFTHPSL